MTIYSVALYLHIVGALLLFTTLSVEGVGLRQVRRAVTLRQVRDSTAVAGLNRAVGPVSALCILVPGAYMTATTWGLVPWIVVGLAAWLAVAVLGAMNGIRLAAIGRAARAEDEPVTLDLTARLRSPLLLGSWLVRVAVVLAAVFLMTVKPSLWGALITIAVALVAGGGAGLILALRGGSQRVPSQQEVPT